MTSLRKREREEKWEISVSAFLPLGLFMCDGAIFFH